MTTATDKTYVDIVFDSPPGPVAGRFVEVEDAHGRSIRFGAWVERPDGYWVLRVPSSTPPSDALVGALRAVQRWFDDGSFVPKIAGVRPSEVQIGPVTAAVRTAVREALASYDAVEVKS